MVGRLAFHEAGDLIDCQKMGIGGKAIPPHIDKVTNMQSDADFILLVRAARVLTSMPPRLLPRSLTFHPQMHYFF